MRKSTVLILVTTALMVGWVLGSRTGPASAPLPVQVDAFQTSGPGPAGPIPQFTIDGSPTRDREGALWKVVLTYPDRRQVMFGTGVTVVPLR